MLNESLYGQICSGIEVAASVNRPELRVNLEYMCRV